MFLFQVWKAVQALVGKTGKESLKRRCIECKPEKIPLAPAKRAKVLLEEYDLEEVRDVSAGAATFYVWVSNKYLYKSFMHKYQCPFIPSSHKFKRYLYMLISMKVLHI